MCKTHKIEWHSGMFCAIERGLINCFLQVKCQENIYSVITAQIYEWVLVQWTTIKSKNFVVYYSLWFDKTFPTKWCGGKTVCFILLLY